VSVTGTSPTPASFPGAPSPGVAVTLGAGAYYLLACVDALAPKVTESNEDNNCVASATTVTITP
jgi:hypothetical protein